MDNTTVFILTIMLWLPMQIGYDFVKPRAIQWWRTRTQTRALALEHKRESRSARVRRYHDNPDELAGWLMIVTLRCLILAAAAVLPVAMMIIVTAHPVAEQPNNQWVQTATMGLLACLIVMVSNVAGDAFSVWSEVRRLDDERSR